MSKKLTSYEKISKIRRKSNFEVIRTELEMWDGYDICYKTDLEGHVDDLAREVVGDHTERYKGVYVAIGSQVLSLVDKITRDYEEEGK